MSSSTDLIAPAVSLSELGPAAFAAFLVNNFQEQLETQLEADLVSHTPRSTVSMSTKCTSKLIRKISPDRNKIHSAVQDIWNCRATELNRIEQQLLYWSSMRDKINQVQIYHSLNHPSNSSNASGLVANVRHPLHDGLLGYRSTSKLDSLAERLDAFLARLSQESSFLQGFNFNSSAILPSSDPDHPDDPSSSRWSSNYDYSWDRYLTTHPSSDSEWSLAPTYHPKQSNETSSIHDSNVFDFDQLNFQPALVSSIETTDLSEFLAPLDSLEGHSGTQHFPAQTSAPLPSDRVGTFPHSNPSVATMSAPPSYSTSIPSAQIVSMPSLGNSTLSPLDTLLDQGLPQTQPSEPGFSTAPVIPQSKAESEETNSWKTEKEIRDAVRVLSQSLCGVKVDRDLGRHVRAKNLRTTREVATQYAEGSTGAVPSINPFCPCWDDLGGKWNQDLEICFLNEFKMRHPALYPGNESAISNRFQTRLRSMKRKLPKEGINAEDSE
ncbi:hypothetical protein R3P38DRAFT_3230722 [Favolaschia claudopus]|uniref:Uncharacterized protein n=1 Tax=Favolaschia claudopus TaxID=2862362 RepID=A0AAV9ZM23_9AGAR